MCLGIPGQIASIDLEHPHLAKVDVVGVTRSINVGLLEDEGVEAGDWVLVHVGFAMSKIDEDEAARALDGLQMMGQGFDDEIQQLLESAIE